MPGTKGPKPVTRKNVAKLKAPPKKEKVKRVRETVWEVEDEEEWREGSVGVSSAARGGGTPREEDEEESEDDVGERRRKKQRSLRRGSTSSSARTPAEGNGLLRPAPVRITRTQARTLSEVRDESLRTAEREQSQSQSQEGFSWPSEKAAKGQRWGGSELSGSDLEGLELEEEEEESDEEEEPQTSMWSSAGGLWGPGPSGEPTLVLPDPLDQGLPSLAHDAPLLPSNSYSDDLSLLFPQLPLADPLPSPSSAEGLVNSALDSLDMPAPTGNSASAANMSMSSGNGGSQSKRKMKVVWREGPERRRRRLSEMEAGNGGGEASSPESDS